MIMCEVECCISALTMLGCLSDLWCQGEREVPTMDTEVTDAEGMRSRYGDMRVTPPPRRRSCGVCSRGGWGRPSVGLLLLTLLLLPAHIHCVTVYKTLVEEVPKWTKVAEIPLDANFAARFNASVIPSFRYEMVGEGEHKEYFDVDSTKGVVRTNQRLDRDTICPTAYTCQASLSVIARGESKYEVTDLVITIEDRNDNTPTFPEPHMSRTISESSPTGDLFLLREASDPDHPDNSTKRYALEGGSGVFQLKVQNNSLTTGTVDLTLVLLQPLDREVKDAYQLKVTAEDGGQPPLTGEMTIDIQVEDTNDNEPRFENSSYTVVVPEDTPADHTILTVHADDPDIGDNGRVSYKFNLKTQRLYGTLFALDPNMGELKLKQELDYEKARSYSLGIMAEDAGTGSIPGSAVILVTVTDVNDNEPLISVDTVEGSGDVAIQENNDPNSFVAHVSVLDPDSGTGGQVECSLNHTHFRLVRLIPKEYKIVTVASMDREQGQRYHLIMECHDLGNPPRSSQANITVHIEDVNDHKPRFEHQVYNVTLYENNKWKALVAEVKAEDYDAGENGQITYMLDEDSGDVFHIDPDTGRITALVSFDREDVSHYDFHVIAADRAEKMEMSRCLVSLTILDVDDNPPLFNQSNFVFSVQENLPSRTAVGRVYASDKDDPPFNSFSYYLDLHSEASLDFSIDPNTGAISTKRMLDRERVPVYELRVMAQSDTAPPHSDTCTVTIYVQDKNDNAPIIDFPTEGNSTVIMSLDTPEGAVVAKVRAHDLDLGANAVVFYMISEGNEGGEFRMEEHSGRVLVNMDPQTFRKTAYDLVIMVKDSGQTPQIAVSTLTIILHDTPLVPPNIPHKPTEPTGSNSLPSGRTVHSTGGQRVVLSATHLAIVISVIVGCIVVAMVLIIAIVVVKKKTKRPPPRQAGDDSDDFYWPKGEHPSGPAELPDGGMEGNMTRDESKMTQISQISDIILALDTEPMNYQSRVQQLQEHSPKSDLDGDSGCADLSNSGSQTSNEDSDGSKRSSKASDAEGGSELPLPPVLPPRPQVLPPATLVPNVPPMPLLQRRYSDRLRSNNSNSPDMGSLRRQRDRYPYEEDSPLRRTFSTPPKSQSHTLGHQVPQGALAAARNLSSSGMSKPSTLPRSTSNCSKKSVRFTDCADNVDRPETPRVEKHVHFADQDDVLNSSQSSDIKVDTTAPEMTESGFYDGGGSPEKSNHSPPIPLSQYPQDGTYTTFIPVKNTSLSSLV